MNLYAVSMSWGLYVVRAESEDDARLAAFEGPALDDDAEPAEEYGIDFDPEAPVIELDPGGARGLITFHFG